MPTKPYRTKYPRKPQIQPRFKREAVSFDDIIQNVQELRAMKVEFQQSYTKQLAEAEKKLNDYIKTVRKGNDGYTPIKGKDYFDGKDGYTPKKGVDYFDGAPGKPGRDGNSPNEDSIAKKVLQKITIPKAPALKEIVSAVMGQVKKLLEIEFDKMRSEIRQISSKVAMGSGGSGGMGTPVKFSFTGDGSTTEFTLPAEPSGEGLAIWPHDQSAWLQPGVHFNVSGKTFTTTYTPEDGVIIEGILIP